MAKNKVPVPVWTEINPTQPQLVYTILILVCWILIKVGIEPGKKHFFYGRKRKILSVQLFKIKGLVEVMKKLPTKRNAEGLVMPSAMTNFNTQSVNFTFSGSI